MITNKEYSCELVSVSADKLPTKVGIREDRLVRIREDYNNSCKKQGRQLIITENALWASKFVAVPVSVALLATIGPATPVALGLFTSLFGLSCGMITAVFGPFTTHEQRQEAQRRVNSTYGSLRKAFFAEQKEAFETRQKALVTLADVELAEDRLLDERTLAYLAAVRPEFLQEAQDERLVISVLQTRALLAWHRCNEKHEDGEKLVKKPLSCATLRLNPSDPLHRTMLREKLERAGSVLKEDSYPNYEEFPIQPPQFKLGFWGYVGRYFANPLFTAGDKRRYLADLPEIKAVDVKPLIAAEDFAAALKCYEKENPPLDLPALRGWPQKRRTLTAAQHGYRPVV